MSQPAPILLQLFGQPELRGVTGRIITRFAGGKSLHLLAILALSAGQDFQRVDLVAELWPGVSHEDGRNRLNVALHHVRKSLMALIGNKADRALVSSRGCLKLEAGLIDVDLVKFEAAAQQLFLQPSNQVNQNQLMLLLEQARAGVMIGYSDDWAVARGNRIGIIVERLKALQHQPASRASTPQGLTEPAPPLASPTTNQAITGDFINSGTTITDIQSWISAGQTRILGVHGPAGVGKSRTSKVALDSQAMYRVVSIRCDALTDEAMLAAALALGLDTPISGTLLGLTLGNIASQPGGKSLILLLDNADLVIGHARSFAQLLTDTVPTAKVIITSREAITGNLITNVRIYPLKVDGTSAGLNGLTLSPALQLFEKAAHRVAPDFEVTPENLASVTALCHFADGIPQAIELIAGKVQLHQPATLVDLLNTEGLVLGGGTDATAQTSAMESLLAWSIQNLPASAQRFLLQCTVFPASFDAEAAAAITGREDANKLLQDLVNASLVYFVQKETLFDGLRYRLLESVRRQCQRLLEPAAQQSLLSKHADYFALVAASIPPAGIGRADFSRLNRCRLDDDNFDQAIDTLEMRDSASAGALVLALAPIWLQTNAHQLHRHVTRMLENEAQLTEQQRVWLYVYAGAEAENRFDYVSAKHFHHQVHTLVGATRKAHWLSSPLMVDILLRDPAMSQWLMGLINAWPEPMTYAVILRHNALHAWYSGDLKLAAGLIDDAMRHAQDSTPAVVRDTHFIKAQFCLWTLETVAARDALEAVIRFYTSSGLANTDHYVWQPLALLASTLITTGQIERARDVAMRAWFAIEGLPPGPGMTAPLLALATAEAILGNHDAAEHWRQTLQQLHSDFLRNATADRAQWSLTDSHPLFAEVALAKGDASEAVALAASGWRHFSQVQPLTPGPQMMGYIAARSTLSKTEHTCGLIDSAAAGVAVTLPMRLRYGIFRDALVDIDIVAAFADGRGDAALAAFLYGGAYALRLRSLHVARPYVAMLHNDIRDRVRSSYPMEWSRGTTAALVKLMEDALVYLQSAGVAA
jgi:predicted ATPase